MGGGSNSLLDQLLALLQSGTFWAAAGVVATLIVGSIPLLVKAKRAKVAATNPLRDEIKARIETRFSDVVDMSSVQRIVSSAALQAGPSAEKFMKWFSEYKEQAGTDLDQPPMTTHQAFLHWFFAQGRKVVYNDYGAFLRMGAHLEQAGYRVGPPLTPAEYHEMMRTAQAKQDEALKSAKPRRKTKAQDTETT